MSRSDALNIEFETVLLEIPRGDDVLRLTHTGATTADGKRVTWHSLRVFWRTDAGEWRPGKQGITIRGGELRGVVDALVTAAGGPPLRAATPARQGETEERIPF